MYLHLGKNVVVAQSEIVAVCDLDNSSHSHITRAFLTNAEKKGQVINVSDDLPNPLFSARSPTAARHFIFHS